MAKQTANRAQLELFTPRPRIEALGGGTNLMRSDLPRLQDAETKLMHALWNGLWKTVDEICEITGQREGVRRLRAVRSYLRASGRGDVVWRRVGNAYEYRIVTGRGRATR